MRGFYEYSMMPTKHKYKVNYDIAGDNFNRISFVKLTRALQANIDMDKIYPLRTHEFEFTKSIL